MRNKWTFVFIALAAIGSAVLGGKAAAYGPGAFVLSFAGALAMGVCGALLGYALDNR